MLTHTKRLESLGITLPGIPKPLASYVPAVRAGNLVYVSGQLPMREGQLMAQGRVGREVDLETAQVCARQCVLNGHTWAVSSRNEACESGHPRKREPGPVRTCTHERACTHYPVARDCQDRSSQRSTIRTECEHGSDQIGLLFTQDTRPNT